MIKLNADTLTSIVDTCLSLLNSEHRSNRRDMSDLQYIWDFLKQSCPEHHAHQVLQFMSRLGLLEEP